MNRADIRSHQSSSLRVRYGRRSYRFTCKLAALYEITGTRLHNSPALLRLFYEKHVPIAEVEFLLELYCGVLDIQHEFHYREAKFAERCAKVGKLLFCSSNPESGVQDHLWNDTFRFNCVVRFWQKKLSLRLQAGEQCKCYLLLAVDYILILQFVEVQRAGDRNERAKAVPPHCCSELRKLDFEYWRHQWHREQQSCAEARIKRHTTFGLRAHQKMLETQFRFSSNTRGAESVCEFGRSGAAL